MSHLVYANKSEYLILDTKSDVTGRFSFSLEGRYSGGRIFFHLFCSFCVLVIKSMCFLSYEIILASPRKTRSGFHFVSSTLCDLVHIPDMLQTACVSECAVSVFSGESPERKQTDSSMHKQLGSCGWN